MHLGYKVRYVRNLTDAGHFEEEGREAEDKISKKAILEKLEPSGHGAIDGVEGAVWRVERKGVVDFLGKYVRPDKVDGKYLESVTGQGPVFNWQPSSPIPDAQNRP